MFRVEAIMAKLLQKILECVLCFIQTGLTNLLVVV